jgi:hypothetical protein
MPVIQATGEMEIGGLQFKDSLGKKLVRPYLKEQDGCGGVFLYSQLHGRWS